MATSNIFDASVTGPVIVKTFPNELFTVSAESAPVPPAPFENKPYTYDNLFGVQFDTQTGPGFGIPGVGPQHTFQSIQTSASYTDYRVSGGVCNFFAEATFDRGADLTSETALVPLFTSPAPPGGVDTAQEEIRLRPLVPLVTQPQPNLSVTSYRLLPSFLRSHLNPRFTRVEMLNSANQSVFPPPTDENEYLVLGARMLHDAVIALTVTQTATAYPSAVISPGQYTRGLLVSDLTSIDEVPNDVIKIIVEGSYLL